jgi:hypothetical protein
MQERFGKTLPWPLSYIIPYTQAMSVRRQFRGQDVHEVLSHRLRSLVSAFHLVSQQPENFCMISVVMVK